MKPSDFKVGQKLWFVGCRSYQGEQGGCEHIVKSVGRRWVVAGHYNDEWSNQRFSPELSMSADGGNYSSPGKYYLTKQDQDDERERDRIVDEIRGLINGYHSLPWITLDAAKRIKAIIDEVMP